MGLALYDEDFFEDVERTARASALRVVPAVVRGWRPRHVVDVGCGRGVWAATFEALGIPVVAIDGAHVRREQVVTPTFLPWDLTRPLPPIGRFDLGMCLEVAEHLPAEAADTLVASLAEVADRVLFSAAVPGQGGTGHVNEQPHEYWIERFDRLGFDADTGWRGRFADDDEVAWWYRRNLIVFERREARPAPVPGYRPAPAPASTAPEVIAARRGDLRRHLDLATGVVAGRAQRRLARLVDRLARPVLRRHHAVTEETLAALEAVDACLGEITAELARLRASVGDPETDRTLRTRLDALEYAVRRLHGPLLT